ncbi:MAG: hypothetical protein COV74_03075 [Candidatus Omnitrophica bacterium CG11_big_fil_rev_8_21_14_0_20_45_26]|uniref:NAD-dependent epimerase/dehydratase domain-containing protein n=1 Tax=Candidatus Abzuiibacterium crystallinum TaxID=1974748 RepID=A0A2H0LR18_9BACT|nr:MAG: hypothetical protein COV74_03075 [Candidatus Omnitrophica bacterium CG11_big_fil_rev_8_21_14_0_20_45_26]PIW64658.1 MAG: hypothetical protein COW12_05100 [Candidatus Omnitrophica bacterium CG12_big_fil_rev_8_21_14_0_65_45_16]
MVQERMVSMFKNQRVLVTGGTGLIGRQLVELLVNAGAKVKVVSLDDPSLAHPKVEFCRVNLTKFDQCAEVCKGMDYVFHLVGVKGSPGVTGKRPASFLVPILLFNTNMMEAARQANVKWYLYTSTIGVYAPAEVFHEDDVWKTFPSENDRFAGWAKRMGELQAEAYKIEYGWNRCSIVRPANVYGPHDNFDPVNAMVIPSLIKRTMEGENPLCVWGDGSPMRDFIHAKDVARAMLLVVEKQATQPINIGSGQGISIKELTEIIKRCYGRPLEIEWDTSKPKGDLRRVMDISRLKALGFKPSISVEEGIRDVMDWYKATNGKFIKTYNVFLDKKPVS